MNYSPKNSNSTNPRGHPPEFQQVIGEKSVDFVGREFVFTAIHEFLHRYNRGYFTIVGAPGSGKSAIIAKYVTENPQVFYYNAQVEGKNQADEFIRDVCTQIVETLDLQSLHPLPDNPIEGSWFLSLLLQKMSDRLEPNQRLIIAIDALHTVNANCQSPGSNLFYLPRYLPDRVYFLLTRRPFVRDKSGLLIETPSQTLDLGEYPEQNREDVQACIQRNLINEPEFIARLTEASENNFMYLSQILPAIANFYPSLQLFEMLFTSPLLPGLEAYYQSHWQKMKGEGLSGVSLGVLRVLVDPALASWKNGGGISAEAIAQLIHEDEYQVEEVLENWLEFLQTDGIGETFYSLYHSSFSHWLSQQI
ncbi:MAG: ATP-binding protein [Rhizonema sp. PD38]|nr:ATP-binding protein [Rhizonema sp. PD38]